MSVNNLPAHAPDQIDWDNLDETTEVGGGGASKFPPKGTYNFTTTAISWERERTSKGYLNATLTCRLNAPGLPYDGHEVRFVNINTQKWPNRNSSSMVDYLRSVQVDARPQSDEEYRALVDATMGASFTGRLNWEAKDGAERIKGMESFPKLKDGGFQSYIRKEGGETVFANSRITSFISAFTSKG